MAGAFTTALVGEWCPPPRLPTGRLLAAALLPLFFILLLLAASPTLASSTPRRGGGHHRQGQEDHVEAVTGGGSGARNTSACVAECMAKYPVGNANGGILSWCGTDGQTYETTAAASSCVMPGCNIAPVFAGTCDCPNNCTAAAGRGYCSSSHDSTVRACRCAAGWGGADCSIPVGCDACRNGHCVATNLSRRTGGAAAGETVPAFLESMCVCDEGWAGPACDVPALAVPQLPWGCLLPPVNTVPGTGCAEPLGNLPFHDYQGMPQVHVELASEALASLYDPAEAYSEAWRPANITWLSTAFGRATRFTNRSGVRIKGSSSRLAPKRSFKLRFHDHHHDDDETAGWPKEASMKASQNLIGAEYITTLLLSMGVPVARSGMALLFINGRFYGLYNMFGTFTKDFIDYWYNGTTAHGAKEHGEWIKAGFYVHPLEPDVQRKLKPPQPVNDTTSFYGRASTWMAQLSSQAEFEAGIHKYLDVDTFARGAVVASLLQLADTVVPSGNNYQWFVSNTTPFSLAMRDFDLVFSPTMDPYVPAYLDHVALGLRLMLDPTFVDLFVNRYGVLLDRLFPPQSNDNEGVVTPVQFFSAYIPYAGNFFALDATALLNHGSAYNFVETAFTDAQALGPRADAVRAQLQSALRDRLA